MAVAILGGGILGTCTALELADRGYDVTIFERNADLLSEASLYNEGKLHLGFVYAADPTFRTADRMIRGAVRFMDILSRWVTTSELLAMPSRPFDYLVHRDTMLSVVDIERHFDRVAETFADHPGSVHPVIAEGRPMWRRMADGELSSRYDPSLVVAAYETAEIAVDTWAIAVALRRCVLTHPRIELRLSTRVTKAEPRSDGTFDIACEHDGARHIGPFQAVLNALWANRPSIDHPLGISERSSWYTRRKLGVNLLLPDRRMDLPSFTAMLGPFGDVVAHQSGRLYLSWYPDCMIGVSTGVEEIDWQRTLSAVDTDPITQRTIAALTAICPGLNSLPSIDQVQVVVNGGSIFALGESDIDDPKSRLHERLDNGDATLERFLSVDTAKFTLGPAIALSAADRIAAMV